MGARYSRQTGYSISRRPTNTRRTIRTVQRRVRFGPTAAKYIGLAALAILAVVMLTQSSTSSTNAYKQNELRSQVSNVEQDIDRLKLEAKRAQSIQSIQQTTVKDQMEQVNRTEYLENGQVAGASTDSSIVKASPSPTPVTNP